MDHTFLPRSVWSGDSKFLHHPADLYTSVVVTRGIPAGTCFGPCVLQNTFYDTIAFIAQKSCDKTAKSYVFRVSCPAVLQHGHLVFREMAPARSLAVVSYYITRGAWVRSWGFQGRCVLETRFVISIWTECTHLMFNLYFVWPYFYNVIFGIISKGTNIWKRGINHLFD